MANFKISLIDNDSLKVKINNSDSLKVNIQVIEPEDITNLKIKMTESDSLRLKLQDDELLKVQMETAPTVGTDNYNNLLNKPQINNVTLVGNKTSADLGLDIVHIDTTSHWNAQPNFIGQEGHLYVYTDYETIDNSGIPAMKIGDGKAYLIDAPFVDGNATTLNNHINNTDVHITAKERLFWNDKVTCFLSKGDQETVIFTKNREG